MCQLETDKPSHSNNMLGAAQAPSAARKVFRSVASPSTRSLLRNLSKLGASCRTATYLTARRCIHFQAGRCTRQRSLNTVRLRPARRIFGISHSLAQCHQIHDNNSNNNNCTNKPPRRQPTVPPATETINQQAPHKFSVQPPIPQPCLHKAWSRTRHQITPQR